MSESLEAKLPTSFSNEVESFAPNLIVVRSSVKNLEECNIWIKEYGKLTNTKWNARTSKPCGQRFVCLKKFVCHHSAFMKVPLEENKRSISKNANCMATINIKVKLDTAGSRKNDSFIKKGLVAVITIIDTHTHSLNTAEAFKFLPASDCKEKFMDYFNDGMGVAEACKYHEGILHLEEKFTEEHMANSQINPPYRTVLHWHNQWRLQNLGPRTGQGLIEKLKERINIYEDHGITVRFCEEPFAVVIVTPIMKRAHNLKSSGEIVFVDSTSSCDPDNHSITFMLCPCSAGAVPLAVIITKGQTEDAYMKGFRLLNEAVEKPFNNEGHPEIFMTDDSDAEINALQNVWPASRNLLCIFHVAQAVWRWLWDSSHQIPKEHRNQLMLIFQNIMYAQTVQEAEESYKNACGYIGVYLPTYANWNKYVNNCWKKKQLWCLAFRNEKVKGHHTNNFSEVYVRIFKDEVLCRVKAYNVLTILDFVAMQLEKHYEKKFRDFSNNRCANPRLFLLSLKKKAASICKEDITLLSDGMFSVKSEDNVYVINTKSACCTCPAGLYGRFCKHQYCVYEHYEIVTSNFPPVLPQDKHEVAVLALGEKAPPKDFFEPLLREVTATRNIEVADLAVTEELSLSSYTSEGDNSSYEEKRQKLLKEIFSVMSHKDQKHKSSLSGLNKFLKKLRNVKSSGSWESFLHTAGNSVGIRQRSGAAIHVQPTSIARRSTFITRGSKRFPAGRPAGAPLSKKRKHSLGANIKLNQPNAKRH